MILPIIVCAKARQKGAAKAGERRQMIEIYDIIFRNAAIGLFVFFGILVLRDFGLRQASILGTLASLAAAAYLVCEQNWFEWPGGHIPWFIVPFCMMAPVIIWLFSLSQFRDHFRISAGYWVLIVVYVVFNQAHHRFGLEYEVLGRDIVETVHVGLRFMFIVHMLFVAWQGRADDLLEARRRFRSAYIILVGFTISVISVAETFYEPGQIIHPILQLAQSSGLLALAFIIMWRGTKFQDGILFVPDLGPARETAVNIVGLSVEDPTEKLDLAEVERLISVEKMYLEPNLTIRALAEKAGLPEHRLRRLINQHLGYRNFADFLNHYRVEAAKQLLAAPENHRAQVLVMAMDLGYGSLGPFNRAFKERTGQTPTEFRKQALADSE